MSRDGAAAARSTEHVTLACCRVAPTAVPRVRDAVVLGEQVADLGEQRQLGLGLVGVGLPALRLASACSLSSFIGITKTKYTTAATMRNVMIAPSTAPNCTSAVPPSRVGIDQTSARPGCRR